MKTINLSSSSIMFKMSFTYSWCRNYSNYLKSTRTRRTRRVFHATFSYILSLSVLQTIRSHRLKLTCLCFVDRKRFELFCICIFFLTQRNKGYLWKQLLIMKGSKQQILNRALHLVKNEFSPLLQYSCQFCPPTDEIYTNRLINKTQLRTVSFSNVCFCI